MEFTDKNFKKEVLETNIPVLIEFWASWCPPCKMLESVIDKLEKDYANMVKIGKLNVDRNPSTSSKYNISGVPTFIIFWKGKVIGRYVASKSENELREIIENVKVKMKNHDEQ